MHKQATGEKRKWSTPELTMIGTVAEITRGATIKQFGGSDGFVLMTDQGIVPIGDYSS